MSRSKNRQLAINMLSSFIAFAVNLGINFFLSPYVIRKLGVEAMGFLRLSSDIIGYTSIITIALNSMAGRFIAISYQQGEIEKANKYFSSVFFSNLILSIAVVLFLLVFLFNIESFFEIPAHLVLDVKLLFVFSILTTVVGLLTNVYGVATFIKNRLELSSIRQIVGNVLRGSSIVLLFGCFPAHLWYYGVTGVIMTVYVSYTNFRFCRYLTPEFYLSYKNFDCSKVVELIKSGIWNVVNKLGAIMGHGFDMIIANICISATAMGVFSISKSIPVILLGMFGMISGVFAPVFTQLWAQNKKTELQEEFLKSIRICGFFANVPLTCLLVFGDSFYRLWLPGQDASLLQLLTIIGSFNYIISMPLEPLWNIFTITNRLKYSTLMMVLLNVLIFATLMLAILFVESPFYRLLILAGTSTFWNNVKNLFFLPLYGAYCLEFPRYLFYRPLMKSVLSFSISCVICLPLRLLVDITDWIDFIFVVLITISICTFVNTAIILKKSDRQFVMKRVFCRKD